MRLVWDQLAAGAFLLLCCPGRFRLVWGYETMEVGVTFVMAAFSRL